MQFERAFKAERSNYLTADIPILKTNSNKKSKIFPYYETSNSNIKEKKQQLFVLEKKTQENRRSRRQKQNRIIHKHQFSTRFMNRSISIN